MSDSPNLNLNFDETNVEWPGEAPHPEAARTRIATFEREARLELLRQRRHEEQAAVAKENGKVPRRLTATPIDTIEMRSIEWFEKPLWQRSAFTLLAGVKGSGKGTYLAALASRVSRNGLNVLIVATEDSAEIDVKPRLVAAGADTARCAIVKQHLQLPDDVDSLRLLADDIEGGIGLLIVDPVANHIGDSNSNSDGEVRHAIAPLNDLANDLGCILIGVRHPGKDRSRGALASILGSTAWIDTPRAVVFIAKDDEDAALRHIQVVANNRSPDSGAQAFRIEGVDVPGLTEPITRAVDLGASSKDVDDLLTRAAGTARISGQELQALILRELATGEKSRDYLNSAADDELNASADSTYQTGLEPLRKAGRIKPRKDGFNGGWHWQLTEAEA